MFRVALDSPLRRPPENISEKQIVLLDGIRFSADMAGIALDRLWRKLCEIDQDMDAADTHGIAEAALDAWSIVDAAHRFVDLVSILPGLPNAPWRRILRDRMTEALSLRNAWQHQDGNAEAMVAQRSQAWGSLAWMQHQDDKPTGRWFLAVAGTEFKGSTWVFAGPVNAVPRTDTRRIRLLHSDTTFYLGRAVADMFEAVGHLEEVVRSGALRLVGEAVNRPRGSDSVLCASIIAVVGTRASDGAAA